jgi:hypothetical protein
MSLVNLARIATAALLVAACSGSDNTQTKDTESPAAMPGEGAARETTMTLAATAETAEAGACELPSGGYAAPCNGCLAAQCCTQIEDCKSDAACGEQLRCIVECQDDENPAACSMACAREDLHAGYVAYDDCSFVECLSTCWM